MYDSQYFNQNEKEFKKDELDVKNQQLNEEDEKSEQQVKIEILEKILSLNNILNKYSNEDRYKLTFKSCLTNIHKSDREKYCSQRFNDKNDSKLYSENLCQKC